MKKRPGLLQVVGPVLLALFGFSGAIQAQDSAFSPRLYVNDRVITNYEVDQRAQFLQLLKAPGDPQEEALKALIEDRLRTSAAEQADITLSAEAVTAGMTEFAARANLNAEQFIEILGQAGVSIETFRDFVSSGLIWREVVRAKFGPKVTVTEAEIDRAIANIDQNVRIRVQVSELVLAATPETISDVSAQARRIKGTIRTEEDFIKAMQRNAGAGRSATRDWQLITSYPEDVVPVLLETGRGKVSEPVRVEGGVALYFVRDLAEEAVAGPVGETVEYAQYLIPNDGGAAAAKTRASVDVCDDLYALNKGQSEDRLTVDTLPIGQVPQAIAQELSRLDPGESSTALTRGQWQVFLMLCSRNPTLDVTPSRNAIRNQLINQRLGGYSERYLAELQAEAFIREP